MKGKVQKAIVNKKLNEEKDKTGKPSDDKAKAALGDKGKSAKPSEDKGKAPSGDKGKSANKETKKK